MISHQISEIIGLSKRLPYLSSCYPLLVTGVLLDGGEGATALTLPHLSAATGVRVLVGSLLDLIVKYIW